MVRPGWIDWSVALAVAAGAHAAVLALLVNGPPGVSDPGADGVSVTLHQGADAPGAGAAAAALSVRPPSPARDDATSPHETAPLAADPAPAATETEAEAAADGPAVPPRKPPVPGPAVSEPGAADARTAQAESAAPARDEAASREPPRKPRDRPDRAAEPTAASELPSTPQSAQVASVPASASGSLDAVAMAGELGAPGGDSAAQGYLLMLREHFDERKRYPRDAYVRGQQGVVRLRFVIDRSGTVLSYEIARSSGHPALDQEVLSLMDRVQPLPPFPADLSRERLALGMPIEFHLP